MVLTPSVEARRLPDLPAYAKPVHVPDPKAGEDPLTVAARERAGRIKANGVIVRLQKWHKGVQRRFGGK